MIILKREESYLSWLSFLIIATLFSTGLHYFYSKNIYHIAIWIIQILMLFYFHSKIKQGSRKSFLFYPFSALLSAGALATLTFPELNYSIEKYIKVADSHFLIKPVFFYIKDIIPLEFSWILILSFFFSLAIVLGILVFYFLKSSLYKTQRFFNGFFSLTGLYFIIMLFFPLTKTKNIVLSLPDNIKYVINNNLIHTVFSYFQLFSGLLFCLSLYTLMSLFRDNKKSSLIAMPFLLFLSFALFYFNLMYLSVFIFNIIITTLIFFLAADGFKKFTYNN